MCACKDRRRRERGRKEDSHIDSMVVSKRLKYFEVTCLSDCDPGN
jgi:hypothetical protein